MHVIILFLCIVWTSHLNAANGLTGKYYNNNSLLPPIVLTRVDSTINFNWGYGSPDSAVNVENFGIIWSGVIIIPETATYTFYCAHDDAMSLKINGTTYYNGTSWTRGDSTYGSTSSISLNAGTYPIEIQFKEATGGAYARLAWTNDKSISTRTIVPSSNLRTLPSISIADANVTEGNSGYKNMNFSVTISEATNASVNYTTSNGTAIAGEDYNATNGTLLFKTTDANLTKIISVPIKGDTYIEDNETFTVTLSNEVNASLNNTTATGTIINDDMGYCGTNSLSNGFHVVNPFDDINKSIEIFCYNNRDFIALPNKNSSNNFVFKTNTPGTNYYSEAINNGTSFSTIEINAYTLDVITKPTLRTPQTVGSFTTMGSSFSNINLTATPFAIDWDNTTISNCTKAKLRTAYYGQDVKINTLDYDSKGICNIDKMKLKLLDDYRYLEYEGNEVLKKSCKTMAEAVPTSFLASSSIKGHYWISPYSKARSYNSTDITSDQRPIVVYCWYQTDLNWVWTFSLAMDGKVTNTKSDLVNRHLAKLICIPQQNHGQS